MNEFTEVNGLTWPVDDRLCRAVVFKSIEDLRPALVLCKKRDVVLQAGGNCGVWPLYLREHFKTVITFEADPTNFACLAKNVSGRGILSYPFALGETQGEVGIEHLDARNIGAHQIDPNGGGVEMICIDQIGLSDLDFLCLDIEGYELQAIKGAKFTINRFRPIIQLEDKGLSERYGTPKGEVIRYLEKTHNYTVVEKINRDYVLEPRE